MATARFLGRVGGADHLARLLANPAYGPLVGHRDARLRPAGRIDDAARVAFSVRARDGVRAEYLLSMVLRPAGMEGRASWRLTGLVRRELEDA